MENKTNSLQKMYNESKNLFILHLIYIILILFKGLGS